MTKSHPHRWRWTWLWFVAWCGCFPLQVCAQYEASNEDEILPLWRIRSEYLYWWSNGNPLPALVTTSPANTPRTDAGVLGTPGVSVLFGEQSIDKGPRSGGRVTISRWLEDEEETIIEFVGFYIADDYQSGDFLRASQGLPLLSRPFFNAQSNEQDAELVAFPGVISGRVTVDTYSEAYSGAIALRQNIGVGPRGRIDVLGGYRYFKLRETLSIRENLVSIDQGGVIPLGTTTELIDRFNTGNDFHGAELGVAAEFFWPAVTLELLAKVGIGGVFQQATIAGSTTVGVPNHPPIATAGGLLALPTNIGAYDVAKFGVLPEFAANLTVALTPDISLLFGYTIVVLTDALRTGHVIDNVVNVSQIGGDPLMGPARPAFRYNDSSFVVQGLNAGLEFRW